MNIRKLAVLFAALVLPVSAWAVPFTASYTIDSHTSGNGLHIGTSDYAQNPFSFELEENNSHSFGLFNIWADESDVGRDDVIEKAISVNFSFSQPGAVSGSVDGETVGTSDWFLFLNIQEGVVTWDDPLELVYGSLNDGLFRIELFSDSFSSGAYGLWGGEDNPAVVKARVTLVRAASVPEPGTLALLGLGLVALGVSRRRG